MIVVPRRETIETGPILVAALIFALVIIGVIAISSYASQPSANDAFRGVHLENRPNTGSEGILLLEQSQEEHSSQ